MVERDPSIPLAHIRDAADRITAYTALGRDAFFASTMAQDAVIRNLEIIGEAVKQLDSATRKRAPSIPWRRIAGMRDVLIHHYFGVDLQTVWTVVENEIPRLKQSVETLLETLEKG